jgi:hypothetical protein
MLNTQSYLLLRVEIRLVSLIENTDANGIQV